MIHITKTKYLPMQQKQVRGLAEMESVYCAAPNHSTDGSVMSLLKRPFYGSGG